MKLQLTNYDVTLRTELGWGDDELIKAEMMSAMRVSAEQRQQINEAAAAADKSGKAMGQDPFKLSGIAMDGTAVLAARIKAAELIITKIEPTGEGEPDTIEFSQNWLYKLPKKDGRLLMSKIDEIRRDSGDEDELEGK